jgi:hypothetical protein
MRNVSCQNVVQKFDANMQQGKCQVNGNICSSLDFNFNTENFQSLKIYALTWRYSLFYFS